MEPLTKNVEWVKEIPAEKYVKIVFTLDVNGVKYSLGANLSALYSENLLTEEMFKEYIKIGGESLYSKFLEISKF